MEPPLDPPSALGPRCAYCLVPSASLKACAACHARSYCSTKCQSADWKKGNGQRHKLWCGQCGENGKDWSVEYISAARGFGLVARRAFAADERVLVERVFTLSQLDSLKMERPYAMEAFNLLAPKGASEVGKFILNCIGVRELDEGAAVGLSLSRANHSCLPNSDYHFDDTDVDQQSVLLVTRVPVAAGEEFTISYVSTIQPSHLLKSLSEAQSILRLKFKIECPPDCVCKDQARMEQARKAVEMDDTILRLGQRGETSEAFATAQALIEQHEQMGVCKLQRLRTMYDAFSMGIAQKKTLPAARLIMAEMHKVALKILGAHSKSTLRYAELVADPSKHRNYLVMR